MAQKTKRLLMREIHCLGVPLDLRSMFGAETSVTVTVDDGAGDTARLELTLALERGYCEEGSEKTMSRRSLYAVQKLRLLETEVRPEGAIEARR